MATPSTEELRDEEAPLARPSRLRGSARARPQVDSTPPAEDRPPEGEADGGELDVDTEATDETRPAVRRFERLGGGASAQSKVMKQAREKEDEGIASWLGTLAADAAIRVQVKRVEPKEFLDPATGQVKMVGGALKRYDRVIDEEEIQRNHGGGLFQLVITKANPRGQFQYLTSRTLEIAGDPKFNDVPRNIAPVAPPPTAPASSPMEPLVGRLFDRVMSQNDRPPPQAPDMSGVISAAVGPYRDALSRMESQLNRALDQIDELRKGDPKKNEFTERMLDKFVDNDSARLTAQRNQFESEIRVIKENALANENRLRDQFERERDNLNRSHERELANIKSANDITAATVKQSHDLQKTMLEAENRRLQREVDELRVDVRELRNKKEPSFRDQITGLRDMKEMMEDVVGGADEKEEKSGIVKVLEGAAGSEVIAGFAQRLISGASGGDPAQMHAAQMAQMQVQQQPRRRGPKLIRDRRTKQTYATDGHQMIPVVRKQQPLPEASLQAEPEHVEGQPPSEVDAATVQPVIEEQQPQVSIPYIPPETVALATNYMTQAFSNNVEPEAFVTGVKMFIPPDVVNAIRQLGAEGFLRQVGGLTEETSHLLSMAGKNWSRKVARYLVGE